MQLTELNAEVSRQKDNLDRVNHHLEEIIDERTKRPSDKEQEAIGLLIIPVAPDTGTHSYTERVIMNLEKEGLVDNQEWY